MKRRQVKVEERKTGGTEERREGVGVTPLPSAASAAAVHNTDKDAAGCQWLQESCKQAKW